MKLTKKFKQDTFGNKHFLLRSALNKHLYLNKTTVPKYNDPLCGKQLFYNYVKLARRKLLCFNNTCHLPEFQQLCACELPALVFTVFKSWPSKGSCDGHLLTAF